jgi:phosphoenolpyruvate phosphomutase
MAKLLTCQEDIVLVVDNTIQYHAPEDNKVQDFVISKNKHQPTRRKISFVCENIISKIGSKLNPETATHEFAGLAKFTKTGAEQFLQTYEDCAKNYHGKFQESEDITRFKFTDLIQEMIDRGYAIHFLEIHKGWLEIHRTEDIELANRFLSNS